jgi:nucleotide-binding universal stress UspA family protein
MFETIVWATDGSELADGALPIAKELARLHGSRIVALHADALLTGRFGGGPVLADEEELRVKLADQVAELESEGFDAHLRIKVAPMLSPAQIIVEAARELEADLIVVATHGYGVVGSLFFGSVAKALVHEATCPVLMIPPVEARAAYDAVHDAAVVA